MNRVIVQPGDAVIVRPEVEGGSWELKTVKPSLGIKGLLDFKHTSVYGRWPKRKIAEDMAKELLANAKKDGKTINIFITSSHGNVYPFKG